jgi:putative tricarboxylic transport membrane protein
VAAAVLLAAGAYLLWEALTGIDGRGPFISGPRLAPIVVSGGWLVTAIVHLAQEIRRYRRGPLAEPDPVGAVASVDNGQSPSPADESAAPADEAPPADEPVRANRAWLTPMLLIATLVAYVLLLETLGFLISSAAFMVAAARILQSRRLVRDMVVAVILVPTIYLSFTRLLDIRLPEGVLPL